jgi:hypothetical protein
VQLVREVPSRALLWIARTYQTTRPGLLPISCRPVLHRKGYPKPAHSLNSGNVTASKDKSYGNLFYWLNSWPSASLADRGPRLSDKDKIVDRRRCCRHGLRIPLLLQVWGSSSPSRDGKSVDISGGGALLETDMPLRVGSILDLRIELPEEITGQPTTEWRCKSRVVRIVPTPSASYPVMAGVHFDWVDVSPR